VASSEGDVLWADGLSKEPHPNARLQDALPQTPCLERTGEQF